jgi:hypothetical protein
MRQCPSALGGIRAPVGPPLVVEWMDDGAGGRRGVGSSLRDGVRSCGEREGHRRPTGASDALLRVRGG